MKNKILFIGDDIRHTTGVANIIQELVLQLCGEYDIVQLACGATQKTTNNVDVVDVSESVSKITGHSGCSVLLYETPGCGSAELLRNAMSRESPNAIIIMTDPYRYTWLFEMENEVRTTCPLMYYHVWDNEPFPKFLKSVYKNCDWIGCISKLTKECIDNVYPRHSNYTYLPHGVDIKKFFKQTKPQIKQNRLDFLGKDYEFVLFCNNVNINRKQLASLIEGFSIFYNENIKDSAKDGVVLLLHTNPDASTGPNINVILDDLFPDLPVLLSSEKVTDSVLNNMYNLSHCTINVASNEGFGLTTLESVATQTPVIMSFTGGLRDQFHAKWSEKIEPSVKLLCGSQKTPYIYSDICSPIDIAKSINKMYSRINKINMKNFEKFLVKNEFTTQQMCNSFKKCIDDTLEKFTPASSINK